MTTLADLIDKVAAGEITLAEALKVAKAIGRHEAHDADGSDDNAS